MFSVNITTDGTAKLVGRLDAAQAANFESALKAMTGAVTLDLSELEYISSVGLGAIVATHNRLAIAGGSLTLVGMNAYVRHIFALARLHNLLTIK